MPDQQLTSPPDLTTQIGEARRNGYTDDDILGHLSQSRADLAPKLREAQDSGYQSKDIIEHLLLRPAPLQKPAVPVFAGETTGNIPGDALMGGVASLAQLPVGGYQALRKVVPGLPAPPDYLKTWTEPPATVAGRAGELATDIGTSLVPGAAEEQALRALGLTSRLGRIAGRAGYEGLTQGAIEGLKSGGDVAKTATAAGLGAGLGGGLEAAGEPLGKALMQYWGKSTGAGGAIAHAMDNVSQDFKDAMRNKTTETDIVQNLKDAVRDVVDKRRNVYQSQLAQIDQNIRVSPLNAWLERDKQLTQYGIATDHLGKPVFSGSPIVNTIDRSLVRRAMNDLRTWHDQSPSGMDTLKRRIQSYGDEATPKAEPFFRRIGESVSNDLKANVPGYEQMTKDYEDASELLNNARRELSTNNPNAGTTFTKLSNLFNQHSQFRRILLESLDNAAGSQLSDQMAGYHLRTFAPRGLAGVGVGRMGATVAGLGAYFHDPKIIAAGGLEAALSSPRVAGEAMVLLSKLRKAGLGKAPLSTLVSPLENQVAPTQLIPPPR